VLSDYEALMQSWLAEVNWRTQRKTCLNDI
jgi:hypothetical protein